MTKVLFAPFKMIGGLLSGRVAKRTFDRVWRVIDKGSPPQPDQAGASWLKLVLALALRGAIFQLAAGAFDRGARETYQRLTGKWPGRQPDPEEQPVR